MNRLNITYSLSIFQRVSSVLSILFIMVLAFIVGLVVMNSSDTIADDYEGLVDKRSEKIESVK